MSAWDAGQQSDLAPDAAAAIVRGAERYGRGSDGQQWEAIEEAAGPICCYAFGHPDQPSPRRKFRSQPWRCNRCCTWWIAKKDALAGTWQWHRVYEMEEVR